MCSNLMPSRLQGDLLGVNKVGIYLVTGFLIGLEPLW